MLHAMFLTLSLSCGLLLLSALCRLLLHARAVRRFGVGTTVLVGRPDDAMLAQRAAAALEQNGLGHLERVRDVIVLDCGLSPRAAEACFASLGGHVRFLPPEALASVLKASDIKQEPS